MEEFCVNRKRTAVVLFAPCKKTQRDLAITSSRAVGLTLRRQRVRTKTFCGHLT